MPKKNKDTIIRPPVIVVLGHIDSGKTTLLDKIREARVAEKESGGITQHIGAYQIEKEEKRITFIDTPGHEAFSQMRSRGAKIADIAILVIDSCKGVERQTKEVISHIKKEKIPLIVALNKIDRPDSSPDKSKEQLQKEGILVESLGGKVPTVELSAKTGKGVKNLLELIYLVSEMENLEANLSQNPKGVIIESYLDDRRGPTATLILNQGILKKGEFVATQSTMGKIKILENFQGKKISEVRPGDPAVFLGLNKVPLVGEKLKVFPDLEKARSFVQQFKEEKETPEEVFKPKSGQKVLNLILKTDVLGSLEALKEVLQKIPQEKVGLRILKSGVGEINENDVKLARSSKAFIVGFRVKINPATKKLIQRKEVKVRAETFEIIYELVEGVRKFMEKLLEPETIRTIFGNIKVLKTFWSKKNRQIVGGRITKGMVKKHCLVEVKREEESVDRGKMISLQKNKQEIERASQGEEVGILYEGDEKIRKGDILVIYKEKKEKGSLDA